MGGNYEKSIYNQLMEVMGRLDAVEKDMLVEKAEHKEDATVVTVNGKQGYIRNFNMENAVVYHIMKDKTIAAMKKLRFLTEFAGILVHDHETALYHFGTEHGECKVHIIRYLKKNSEESGNEMYCNILTIIETLKRRNMPMLENIKKLFMGTPAIF